MFSVNFLKQTILIVLLFLVIEINGQPVLSLTPVITTGLSSPMQLVHAGDGSNRIFIVQKEGSILVYNKTFGLIGTFLTVTNITTSGEGGLLSLAFHPNFSSNGLFYVYYTNSNNDLQLARYAVYFILTVQITMAENFILEKTVIYIYQPVMEEAQEIFQIMHKT